MPRHAILNRYTLTDIVRLSFATIYRALRSDELTLKEKAELAVKIGLKRIPSIDAEIASTTPTNKVLIYVSNDGEGEDQEQILSSCSTDENSLIESKIQDSDRGEEIRQIGIGGERLYRGRSKA